MRPVLICLILVARAKATRVNSGRPACLANARMAALALRPGWRNLVTLESLAGLRAFFVVLNDTKRLLPIIIIIIIGVKFMLVLFK